MKVVFAVSTIFHVEHLKRVYRQWDGEAEFLLFGARESGGTRETAAHLERMGARFRHVSEFLAGGDKADVTVSVYWQPAFLVMGPETMHVRIMYGYAKDEWNYGAWNRNYDLIFTYGPYAEERLKAYAPCISVGHPRAPDRLSVENRNPFPAPGRKPVLLYCPTYGAMSSLPEMDGLLAELAGEYEVVVKLHHMSHADEYPQLMRLARESRIRLYDQRADLFDLLPSCDLVVSDHSGAIFDAMLLGKNIVLADSTAMLGRIRAELDADSASLDIKVRNVLPHYRMDEIVRGIRETLRNPPDYHSFVQHLYAGAGIDVPERIRAETMVRYRQFPGENRQQRLFQRLIRFIRQDHRELVICGAGDFGQAVMQLCKSRGCDSIRFIDGDPGKQGGKIDGIPVFPPVALKDFDPAGVKCLVATVGGAPAYEQWLRQAGFMAGEDYVLAF